MKGLGGNGESGHICANEKNGSEVLIVGAREDVWRWGGRVSGGFQEGRVSRGFRNSRTPPHNLFCKPSQVHKFKYFEKR